MKRDEWDRIVEGMKSPERPLFLQDRNPTEMPKGDYEQARGCAPRSKDESLPEEAIRKVRGG